MKYDMNKIWDGIQNIGDDLVLKAEESAFRSHFTKKKRQISYIAIAASILVILSTPVLYIFFRHSNRMDNEAFPENWETNSSNGVDPIDIYYIDIGLPHKLYANKISFKKDEKVDLSLFVNTENIDSSGGDIFVKVNTDEFIVEIDGENKDNHITPFEKGIEFTEIKFSLIPKDKISSGEIGIDIHFSSVEIEIEDAGSPNDENTPNSFIIPFNILDNIIEIG